MGKRWENKEILGKYRGDTGKKYSEKQDNNREKQKIAEWIAYGKSCQMIYSKVIKNPRLQFKY